MFTYRSVLILTSLLLLSAGVQSQDLTGSSHKSDANCPDLRYNTGGVINCYKADTEIPVSGQSAPEYVGTDAFVKQLMLQYGAVNVSVSAVHKTTKSLVYDRSFGHAVSDWRSRSTSIGYDYFRQEVKGLSLIASLTKPITEAVIRKQIAAGKASLSDNVIKCTTGNTSRAWLTGYTVADPRACAITIQNVLDFKVGYEDFNVPTPPEQFQTTLNTMLKWAPGTQYYYNEFGHQLLGAVIEKVSGLEYEEVTRREVLRPLGIKDTEMYLLRDSRPQYRKPLNVWHSSIVWVNSLYGDGTKCGEMDCDKLERSTSAGSWISSTNTYAKFALAYPTGFIGAASGVNTVSADYGKFVIVVFVNKNIDNSQALKIANAVNSYLSTVTSVPTVNYWVTADAEVLVKEYTLTRPQNGRSAYFITSDKIEQDSLAAALLADPNFLLKPTGQTFKVWLAGYTGTDVLRFVFDIKDSTSKSVGSSHYYGLDKQSVDGSYLMQLLHGNNPFRDPAKGVMFERTTYSAYPQLTDGTCAAGQRPLYQLYNRAFQDFSAGKTPFNDGNHRFTTDTTIYNQMIASGWNGEGIAYCVRQ